VLLVLLLLLLCVLRNVVFKESLNSLHRELSIETRADKNIFVSLGQEFFKNLLVRILVVALPSGSLCGFIEQIFKFLKSLFLPLLTIIISGFAKGVCENLLPAMVVLVG
jgi:fatty acid desaturase